MKAMKKSLMMRGMVLLHYGITVLLFVSCWRLFYGHVAAGSAFGAINVSVYAFYAVSLMMLCRIYNAYRVGLLHAGDLFYGQVLSNLISLGLTYLLACALARRLINPLADSAARQCRRCSARAGRSQPTDCTFPCTSPSARW